MAAYGRPGVYLSERLLPAPVPSAGTANAAGAVIGSFAQGPTDVTLVTSWYDFVKKFGGYNTLYPATFGVGLFFQNGGSELYVQRILHTTDADATKKAKAATASIPASSGTVATATANNLGADGNNIRLSFTASNKATVGGTAYFDLSVYREYATGDDVLIEQYTNVIFNDATSTDYVLNVVNLNSSVITLSGVDVTKTPTLGTLIPLTTGQDGIAPTATEYTANLAAFSVVNRPLVIFAPEINAILGSADGKTVQQGLQTWAAANSSFAVLDTPGSLLVADAVTYATGLNKSSNSAVYYPNIYISDPVGRSSASLRKVGVSGAVAGLYIQTDKAVGPFKAPAGVYATIRGAVALEKAFTNTELDTLNSAATPLNALRNLPGAGIVSMGARTLLQDGTANRYVNTRRSLIFIESSLTNLSRFALFENNDEKLWNRISTALGGFLNDYRNQGGLRGATPDQAYYVKVDAENNPDDAIARGEVHIEIGVALQYPAEFIVINLTQKTAN